MFLPSLEGSAKAIFSTLLKFWCARACLMPKGEIRSGAELDLLAGRIKHVVERC